jgi:hypothetical protein
MSAIVLALLLLAQVEKGEEVEVTSGAVTALSCAMQAKKTGNLEVLNACPMIEAQKEIVVFDVAEKQIYRISKKAVHRFELEGAFGGGSIDFSGVVVAVDASGAATVDVSEYSVMARPKAGGFKGCL